MRLNKLIIQNFSSIRDATLYLANKGLVSINGVNEDKTGSDSNGSGKSSIINAILWCLYGNYGKDEAADDIVNSQAGKNCMVQCIWREELLAYRITRYRKHTKGKNSITVEQLDMPLAQGEASDWRDITKAGAQAVQEQINTIMGASEHVFRASCFAQQEDTMDIPGMTDRELKALLEAVLPFDDLSQYHAKAVKARQAQQAVIDDLNLKGMVHAAELSALKRQLKDTLDARLRYTDETDKKNTLIDGQIKMKKLAYGVALTMANKGTLEDEIEALDNTIALIGDTDSPMAIYRLNNCKATIKNLRQQIKSPAINCSKCGQQVIDKHTLLTNLHGKLNEALDEEKKKKLIYELTLENRSRKNDLLAKKDKLLAQLYEANTARVAADRLSVEISLLEGQKGSAGENPYNAPVKALRDSLKAVIAKDKDYNLALEEAKERLELLKAVELTYSPKGLRYHILEKVAPRLTADTNKYLQTLTDGATTAIWSTVSKTTKGDFTEKFSIQAGMEGRTKFGLLSGGEKRKVRVACFFALQDLIASQATKHIDIWIGDEIDHALDGAGMERLMSLLNEKTKTKSTILVISHNELRDWIPNHATVTRKDGVSTITGILNAP